MLGTTVNVIAIIIGSSTGALLKKGLKEKYKNITTQSIGLVTIALGSTWIVTNMSESKEPLLFIVSLVIGGIIGELLDIDERTNRLGTKFSKKGSNESNLIEGLITAVLLFCVGTLSILGPIESALKGDNTLLFTNAILDGITSLILASTFGIGIILSALFLFIWQGTIYLSANIISPYLTPEILGQVSIIGGILIFSTGLNILKITKIKTLNILPALFIPVIYYIPVINDFFQKLFSFFS
ncbi:MAG: DUF554 domain-containing protein [Vulcanibacillus sp.]